MSEEVPFGYCRCGCGNKTGTYGRTYSKRGMIKGQPLRYLPGHSNRKSFDSATESTIQRPTYEDHFWEQVNKSAPNGCWEWTAGKYASGYGIYWDGKRRIRAHRYAWELTNGPIPDELCCLHICDNRACVNPAHIFLGTKGDNAHDMARKQRSTLGERNCKAKLTQEQIAEIRRLYADGGMSQQKIADRFGIHQTQVSRIVLRKHWRYSSEW